MCFALRDVGRWCSSFFRWSRRVFRCPRRSNRRLEKTEIEMISRRRIRWRWRRMREEREMENAFRRRERKRRRDGNFWWVKTASLARRISKKHQPTTPSSAPSATPTLTGNLWACIIRSRRWNKKEKSRDWWRAIRESRERALRVFSWDLSQESHGGESEGPERRRRAASRRVHGHAQRRFRAARAEVVVLDRTGEERPRFLGEYRGRV